MVIVRHIGKHLFQKRYSILGSKCLTKYVQGSERESWERAQKFKDLSDKDVDSPIWSTFDLDFMSF